MRNLKILLTVLATTALLHATEARVESMGSNSDFVRDDISVFENPATCFDYGNLLVGALGKLEKNGNSWVRKDEWFGGWAVYPLKSDLKLALGATLNRSFDIIKQYESLDNKDFFWVNNGDDKFHRRLVDSATTGYPASVDYLDVLNMRRPYGNVYLFAGANYANFLSVAVGGRYAGYRADAGPTDNSSISIKGGNIGLVYRFDQNALEASLSYDNFMLSKVASFTTTNPADPTNSMDVSYDESNYNVGLRMFYTLSPKTTVIPVLLLNKINLLGVDNTDLGGGIGVSRSLYKGLIWLGMKYVRHSATYPELVGGQTIYSKEFSSLPLAGVKESSHKLIYSFGVEKKMLWDWFTLRVGGNKVFEYLTKKDKDEKNTLEKALEERDVDAVAWGVALGTPDDRLKFDITVSEEFPYSNFLSGGEDGVMFYRISAALKF